MPSICPRTGKVFGNRCLSIGDLAFAFHAAERVSRGAPYRAYSYRFPPPLSRIDTFLPNQPLQRTSLLYEEVLGAVLP